MNLNKGWQRTAALLTLVGILALFAPNFAKAIDVNVFLYTCVANDGSATENPANWGACDNGATSTNTSLNADDSSIETHTSNRKFAGVKITTTNWAVSDCSTVTAVTLYYKWWSNVTGGSDNTHYIDVSDDGSTWGRAVDAVEPTSEPTGISSVDVTALDGWDCGDFGSSGAAQIMSNFKDGTNDTYTYTWDVLFFQVSYTQKGTLTPLINIPDIDNNSYFQNLNFDVSGTVSCTTANCGTVNSTLRYCQGGAGCTGWMDLNSSAGSLKLVSGSNPQSTTLNSGQSYDVNWVLVGGTTGTYELRLGSAGTTANDGNTSGTDRTITVSAADTSFSISYPATGCTQGKGSTDAVADCELCYFETTDLSGTADETQVACEGQTAGTAFFVFNNQSTSNSDLNWYMDLNAALPSVFRLKISTISSGYQATCDENAETGCVNIDANALTFISTVNYSAGSEDEKGWVWTDFVGALPSDNSSLVLTHTTTGS